MRLSVLVLSLFASLSCYSQQTVREFKGNRVTISGKGRVTIADPVGGTEHTMDRPGRAIKINGEDIYEMNSTIDAPEYKHEAGKPTKLVTLIFESMRSDLQPLSDGEYILEINNPVINKEGKLAYYEYRGVQKLIGDTVRTTIKNNEKGEPMTYKYVEMNPEDKSIPEAVKTKINRQAVTLLDHLPVMSSGMKNGKPINTTGSLFNTGTRIVVKDHVVKLTEPAYFAL